MVSHPTVYWNFYLCFTSTSNSRVSPFLQTHFSTASISGSSISIHCHSKTWESFLTLPLLYFTPSILPTLFHNVPLILPSAYSSNLPFLSTLTVTAEFRPSSPFFSLDYWQPPNLSPTFNLFPVNSISPSTAIVIDLTQNLAMLFLRLKSFKGILKPPR